MLRYFRFFVQVKSLALCVLMYTSILAFILKEPVAAIKPSSPLPLPAPAPSTLSAPVNAPASKPVSAIKKGFLSTAKSSIYPESITAKIKPQTNGLKSPPILLPDSTRKKESGSIRGGLNLSMGDGIEGTGSLVKELTDSQIKQLTKTGNITKAKLIPPPVPNLAPALVLAPSTSTPALHSDLSRSPTRSPITTLPPPVLTDSSASSSSSPTSPVDEDVHVPSLSSSQTPFNAPQYTLLERGIVSMGDFEALKGRNTSTRYTTTHYIAFLFIFLSSFHFKTSHPILFLPNFSTIFFLY